MGRDFIGGPISEVFRSAVPHLYVWMDQLNCVWETKNARRAHRGGTREFFAGFYFSFGRLNFLKKKRYHFSRCEKRPFLKQLKVLCVTRCFKKSLTASRNLKNSWKLNRTQNFGLKTCTITCNLEINPQVSLRGFWSSLLIWNKMILWCVFKWEDQKVVRSPRYGQLRYFLKARFVENEKLNNFPLWSKDKFPLKFSRFGWFLAFDFLLSARARARAPARPP